jgi:hypothetical protein
MHERDGIDKVKYEAKKIWKLVTDNKKITIGVIIALIILFELIF